MSKLTKKKDLIIGVVGISFGLCMIVLAFIFIILLHREEARLLLYLAAAAISLLGGFGAIMSATSGEVEGRVEGTGGSS